MSKKEQNRAMFPIAASVVDDFRASFGASVKLTYACEGGNSVGIPLDESEFRVVSGADMHLATPKKAKK